MPPTMLDGCGTAASHEFEDNWVPTQYYDPEFVARVDADLDKLAQLPAEWDKFGAPPISRDVIDAAKRFIRELPEHLAPRPYVTPLAPGNLQFEWQEGDRLLQLEFEDARTIRYLKWDPTEQMEDEDVFSAKRIELATNLIRWFIRGVENV